MNWRITYTDEAKQDLRKIYEYIACRLLEPDTAARQARRIMRKIRALDEMPMRYRLYDEEPWHSQGLRFFPVDHYLVFYIPDETKTQVDIVRIMYGGRDISSELGQKHGFETEQ